jgi:hypothetical protein
MDRTSQCNAGKNIMKLLSYALDQSMEPRLGLYLKNRVVDVLRISIWLSKEAVIIDFIDLPTSMELLLKNWTTSIKILEKIEGNLQIIPLNAITIEGKQATFHLDDVHIFPPLPQPPTFRIFSGMENIDKDDLNFYYTNPTSLMGYCENIRKPHYVNDLSAEIELVCFITKRDDKAEIAGISYVLNWYDSHNLASPKSYDFATSIGPFLYVDNASGIEISIAINENELPKIVVSNPRETFKKMIKFSGEYLSLNSGDVLSTGSIAPHLKLSGKCGDKIQCQSSQLGDIKIEIEPQNPPKSKFDLEEDKDQ